MSDLVVTCPMGFWPEWIAEGDAVGDPYTGQEWGWYMNTSRPDIAPGERLYVVAHGQLRGYAPVTRLIGPGDADRHHTAEWKWCICRRGDAVAITVDQPIPGFRGWRRRWWDREIERPFPEWRVV